MADMSALKLVYRIVKWSTLVLLVWSLVLILHKSRPPEVSYDATASARVHQKFAAADQARAAGAPAQVELDATEVNSYLHDNLGLEGAVPRTATATSQNPAGARDPNASATTANSSDPQTVAQVRSTVKDVKIDLEGDLIKAYVIFDFHGKDLSLELDGRLGAQDGYLSFQPVHGQLGSFPLPQSALDSAVERLMSSPENREALKLPDIVSDIRVADGEVVVRYK
jgi:hypothetical protein